MSEKPHVYEIGRMADDGCPHDVEEHPHVEKLSEAEALVLVGLFTGGALRRWSDGWRLPIACQTHGRGDQLVRQPLFEQLVARGFVVQSESLYLRATLTAAGVDAAIDHFRAVVGRD